MFILSEVCLTFGFELIYFLRFKNVFISCRQQITKGSKCGNAIMIFEYKGLKLKRKLYLDGTSLSYIEFIFDLSY